jgi:rare lipoprotein A
MQTSGGEDANGPASAARAGQGRFRVVGLVLAVGCLAVAGCTSTSSKKASIDPRYGVSPSPQVVGSGEPVPQGGGRYMVGKPYRIAGKWYKPVANPENFEAIGIASWYGPGFHGRRTANGEVFDQHSLSAAHPTLPLPSYVRVTNTANGASVIVRVNDRGPYHGRRVIDVSRRVAEMLDFKRHGMGRVRVEYVGLAPIEGRDTAALVATYRDARHGPAPAPGTTVPATPAEPRALMIASKQAPATRVAPAERQSAPLVRSTERGVVRTSPAAARQTIAPPAAAPVPVEAVEPPSAAPDIGTIEIAGLTVTTPRARPTDSTIAVASLDPALAPTVPGVGPAPAAADAVPAPVAVAAAPAPMPEPIALVPEPGLPAYGAAATAAASLGLSPRMPVPNPNAPAPSSIDDLIAAPPPPAPSPGYPPAASFAPSTGADAGGLAIGRFVAQAPTPGGAPLTR